MKSTQWARGLGTTLSRQRVLGLLSAAIVGCSGGSGSYAGGPDAEVGPGDGSSGLCPGGGGLPTGIDVYGTTDARVMRVWPAKTVVCLRLVLRDAGPAGTRYSMSKSHVFPLTSTAAAVDGRQAQMVTFDLSVKNNGTVLGGPYGTGTSSAEQPSEVMTPGPWQWLIVKGSCPDSTVVDQTSHLQMDRRIDAFGDVLAEGNVTVSCGMAPVIVATKLKWSEGYY
jgi:hypothetical protein